MAIISPGRIRPNKANGMTLKRDVIKRKIEKLKERSGYALSNNFSRGPKERTAGQNDGSISTTISICGAKSPSYRVQRLVQKINNSK